jgi:hypothetical protein
MRKKRERTKQDGKVGGCTVKQPRTILRRQKEHHGSEITVQIIGATGNMKTQQLRYIGNMQNVDETQKVKNKKGNKHTRIKHYRGRRYG